MIQIQIDMDNYQREAGLTLQPGINLSAVAAHNIRKLRSRHGVAYNPKFYLEDK